MVFGNLELKRRSSRKSGHLATFQRCDVATSRRLVNREKSISDPTLQCLNVATSLRFLPQNHKMQERPNFEASKNVRTGARKEEQ